LSVCLGSRLLGVEIGSARVQIWCPWVRCVTGELQYELLLGIFWENAYEPCSFGPEDAPLYPFGRPLPPAPPQTKVLGVDKSQAPRWKVDVHIRTLYGAAEKLPPPGYRTGCGPDLGRVSFPPPYLLFLRHIIADFSTSIC